MYDRMNDAIKFATDAHAGQLRKATGRPYILHPMEVAAIVSTMTHDEDVMIAALLHDTIEDCGIKAEEIKEKFGERVLFLVSKETENKRESLPPEETWQIRKEESLEELAETDDLDVKRLWLADKLSNMRSFARQYRLQGDELWLTFHQHDPEKQAWYYSKIAESVNDLSDQAAYVEYMTLLNYVFEDHGGGVEFESELLLGGYDE